MKVLTACSGVSGQGWSFVFVLFSTCIVAAAQSLSPGTPSQEFIRGNGQVIAVENSPGGTVIGGAPSGWTNKDINGASTPSTVTYSPTNNTYTLAGSGTGLTGTADQFQFAYFPVSNDSRIVAHLKAIQNAGPSSLVGIMFRDSTDPGSEYLFLGAQGGQNAYGYARGGQGGQAGSFGSVSGTVPEWFMMQRFGETIFVYVSSDGKNWVQLGGEARLGLHPNVLIGMAVASGSSSGALTTATFDNVTVDQYPPFFSLGAYMAGDYFLLTNAASGKVLESPGGSVADGSPLRQWGLNNGTWQQWAPVLNPNGCFYIASRPSNLVLSLSGSTVVQSAQQWRDDQCWFLRSNDSATVTFVNKSSGLALVINGSTDAQPLQQATYDPAAATQKWQIVEDGWAGISVPTPVISTTASSTVSVSGSVNMYAGLYGYGAFGLGAYNSSYIDAPQVFLGNQLVCSLPLGTYSGPCTVPGVTDGAQLVMKEANLGLTVANETLHVFQLLPNTHYKIKNRHSGLYLRWNAAGAKVDQVASGGAEMQWSFVPVAGGYDVVNQATGGLLGVLSASASAGQGLTVSVTPDTSQLWQVSALDHSNFALLNSHSGIAGEIRGPYNPLNPASSDPSTQAGQPADQAVYTAADNQQWVLVVGP